MITTGFIAKRNPKFIPIDPKGIKYLADILKFLDNNVHEELFLTANFILKNPYRENTEMGPTEVIARLSKHYAFPDHWSICPQYYRYRGGASQHGNSFMGTFIFIKRKHDKITWTKNRRLDANR